MSGRLAHSVAASVMAVVGVIAAAGPAYAADTPKPNLKNIGRVAFGLQPATRGKIDGRPGYRYGVTPGARLADQVAVRNLSTAPVTFQVYATDAVNSASGDFGLLARASRPHDVGRWLAVGGMGFNGSVRVAARGTVVLPLALSVPSDAQPGDHTGAVIVSLATASKTKDGANVILDQRVAARVFIRVSGSQRPGLTINPVHADYRDSWNPFGRGRSTIRYTVTNTGNINLGGRQRVVVRGLLGPGRRSAAIVDLGLLLPGGTVEVTTRVPRTLPLIRERAQVSIVPLVQVGDQVSGLRTYTGSATFWAVPWTLLALLLLLVAAGELVRRACRGGPGRRPSASSSGAVVLGERRARRLGVSTSPSPSPSPPSSAGRPLPTPPTLRTRTRLPLGALRCVIALSARSVRAVPAPRSPPRSSVAVQRRRRMTVRPAGPVCLPSSRDGASCRASGAVRA